MECRVKTFKSDTGDCIFFILKEEDVQFSVMIDCGAYDEPIKNFVHDVLHRKLDLLIVTHVDNDHILGIEEMLRNEKRLKIGRIVFNCYQRSQDGKNVIKFTEAQKQRVEQIQSELGMVYRDIVENDVSAQESVRGLSPIILSRPTLKEKWGRDYTVAEERCDIDLEEFGVIKFVSPHTTDLEKLDRKFKELLCSELFVDGVNIKSNKKENIYEMLLRYASMDDAGDEEETEKDAAGENEELSEKLEAAVDYPVKEKNISDENKASLAFVWEKDAHRVLFMGDARPGRIVEGLLRIYPCGPFPLTFDAIQVSHHGSHYNTTVDLMRLIDSEHYFVTGGGTEERPSIEAMGRIICRALPQGIEKRVIHVNYPNELVEKLKEDEALQQKWHYEIKTEDNNYEFTF